MTPFLLSTALAAAPDPGIEAQQDLPTAPIQVAGMPINPDAFTAEQAASFGDQLLEAGDPYNALTWYRMALFLDHPQDNQLKFRTALAYERGAQWSDAADAYGMVGGDLSARAEYRSAICEFQAGRPEAASVGLEMVTQLYPDSPWAPKADFTQGVLALRTVDLEGAHQHFEEYQHPEQPWAGRAAELTTATEVVLPTRSPLLAATLSGLVPGAGQVYAGHVGDGVMAALFNGLFAASSTTLILDGIDRDAPLEIGAGAVFGLLFVATYPSNILGAYRGAERTNDRREQLLAQDLLGSAWDPALEFDANDVSVP